MIKTTLFKILFLLPFIASFFANAQSDSIMSYDLNSHKEEVLTFNRTTTGDKIIKPFFGTYPPVDLTQFSSKIKVHNSDISPMVRTRDIFGGLNKFPISTVVKLIKFVNNKEVGTCTGTMVNSDFLISAAHCIKTEENKYPDKIVVLPMYDNNNVAFEKDTIYIEKLYYKKDYNKFSSNLKEIEECTDLTLYKLSKKIGNKLGFIGINLNLDLNRYKKKPIYNFSYPNKSFLHAYILGREKNKSNESLVKTYDDLIKKESQFTPDFNKNNQYYRFGNINEIKKGTYFKYNINYCIAGESGSSWINSNYYLLGIVSTQIENQLWSCNNRDLLKAYIEIILQNQYD